MIKYINVDNYNMDKIPENISISTMNIGCNLGTSFNIENIYDYLDLENDNIVAIKKSGKGYKCLEEYKYKFKSMNKNSKKNFYNQITLIIKVRNDIFINIKIFKNGSLQLSGCKSLMDVNSVINKLITRLVDKNNTTIYVKNADDIKLTKFKIDFINSNFGVNYEIKKVSLYKILIDQKIMCILAEKHAPINIKYKIDNVKYNIKDDIYISIFLFQTGNIIITGAKEPEYVKDAYIFIVKILNKYKSCILKKDIMKILTPEEYAETFI